MKFVRKIKQNRKWHRYHRALLKERRMHNRNMVGTWWTVIGGLHAGFCKMQCRGVLSPQMPDGSCIFLRLWLLNFIISTNTPQPQSPFQDSGGGIDCIPVSQCCCLPPAYIHVHVPAPLPPPPSSQPPSLNTPSLAHSFDPHGTMLQLWRWRSLVFFA